MHTDPNMAAKKRTSAACARGVYRPLRHVELAPAVQVERLASLVVPTLREDQVRYVLERLSEHLRTIAGWRFEILLVDDSPEPFKHLIDVAIASCQRLEPRIRVQRVDGPELGKGAAVKVGVSRSRGEVVFLMDADLPVPLEHVEPFLRAIDDGFDIVIAERPWARNRTRPIRLAASTVLFAVQRLTLLRSARFRDTQCGFKAFRGELVRNLACRQIVDGGMVDVEYLHAASRQRAKVHSVVVVPNASNRSSRIDVPRAMFTDPVDLVRIGWRGFRGGYGA